MAGLNEVLLARCDAPGRHHALPRGLALGELVRPGPCRVLGLRGRVRPGPLRIPQGGQDRDLLSDGNTYAAGPVFGGRTLTIGLRHDVVQILEHSER